MICIETVLTANALEAHWEGLESILKKRIKKSKLQKEENDFLISHLKNIIMGKPEELLILQENFNRLLCVENKEVVQTIFDYHEFSREKTGYWAYRLAENLDIKVCPYCNRLYTTTVYENPEIKIGKCTRPEFDHYFPQCKYPLLALSFYNLIPSCHVCNSNMKGAKEFLLKTHLHPYCDDVIHDYHFGYMLVNMNDIRITLDCQGEKKECIKKTFEEFKICEIYNEHRDIAIDMRKLKDEFSDDYLGILAKTYRGLDCSKENLYRLAFGTYLEEENFLKRPFSKFKKDIAEQIGII